MEKFFQIIYNRYQLQSGTPISRERLVDFYDRCIKIVSCHACQSSIFFRAKGDAMVYCLKTQVSKEAFLELFKGAYEAELIVYAVQEREFQKPLGYEDKW